MYIYIYIPRLFGDDETLLVSFGNIKYYIQFPPHLSLNRDNFAYIVITDLRIIIIKAKKKGLTLWDLEERPLTPNVLDVSDRIDLIIEKACINDIEILYRIPYATRC